MSRSVREILEDCANLHDKKQLDYGRPGDPFANVRASRDFGIPPWIGTMTRANDKMKRIQSFVLNGDLANESITDSFEDLITYVAIAASLYEEGHP